MIKFVQGLEYSGILNIQIKKKKKKKNLFAYIFTHMKHFFFSKK
jgi:hypothetical protein